MTREEAIERLKTDIYKYADFTKNPNENEFWMAFDMAIKALEQQPILDKIRDEIEEQERWLMSAGYTAYNVSIAFDAIKSQLKKARNEE